MQLLLTDITTLAIDGIVNAANPGLLGGGGVDAAIHHRAGPQLLESCRNLPESSPGIRCPTGQARITPGFDLAARYVIHTVGPIWRGGYCHETEALESCYRNSMLIASEYGLHSIAFPAISCGAYGFPFDQAARIALRTLIKLQHNISAPQHVVLTIFRAAQANHYRQAADSLGLVLSG